MSIYETAMVKLVKEIVDTVVSVVPQAAIIEDIPVVGNLIDSDSSDSTQSASPPPSQSSSPSPSQTDDSSQDEIQQDMNLVKEIVDTVGSPVDQFMGDIANIADQIPVVGGAVGSVLGDVDSSILGGGMSGSSGGESDEDEEQSTPSFSPP